MGRFRKYHIKENIFWLISNCRSSSNQHWYIFVSLGILIVLSVQWCARQWPEMICHSLRSYHNISPPDPWKWSNGVGKKWNEHYLMYIYHKQCEKFNETVQTANFIDFPLISCGNGPKQCKFKRFFSDWKISEVSRVCHRKSDVQGFLKMCGFCFYNFLPLKIFAAK